MLPSFMILDCLTLLLFSFFHLEKKKPQNY
jgi:hypothetical protein